MKIIISLNSSNENIIIKQIEIFKKNYPHLIEIIGKLENFFPFNQYNLNSDLWFLKTEKEEFINVVYKSINERNKHIKSCNKPIIIIDKGVIDYDAFVLNYLLSKSLNEKESLELMRNKKNEFNIENVEDFQILFMSSSKNEKFCDNEEFQKFLKYNQELIEKLSEKEEYKVIKINSNENIDDIAKYLNYYLYNSLKTKLSIPNNTIIFTIDGSNESSKNNVEKYLTNRYNTWKLNLNYFNYEICQQYNIKKKI